MEKLEYLRQVIDRENAILEVDNVPFAKRYNDPEEEVYNWLVNLDINSGLLSDKHGSAILSDIVSFLTNDIDGEDILTPFSVEEDGESVQIAVETSQSKASLGFQHNQVYLMQKRKTNVDIPFCQRYKFKSYAIPRHNVLNTREYTETEEIRDGVKYIAFSLVAHDKDKTGKIASNDFYLEVSQNELPKKFHRFLRRRLIRSHAFQVILSEILKNRDLLESVPSLQYHYSKSSDGEPKLTVKL